MARTLTTRIERTKSRDERIAEWCAYTKMTPEIASAFMDVLYPFYTMDVVFPLQPPITDHEEQWKRKLWMPATVTLNVLTRNYRVNSWGVVECAKHEIRFVGRKKGKVPTPKRRHSATDLFRVEYRDYRERSVIWNNYIQKAAWGTFSSSPSEWRGPLRDLKCNLRHSLERAGRFRNDLLTDMEFALIYAAAFHAEGENHRLADHRSYLSLFTDVGNYPLFVTLEEHRQVTWFLTDH